MRGARSRTHISGRVHDEDVGIDAHVELWRRADEPSGFGVGLQVKAGESYIRNETESAFTFYPSIEDLQYWRSYAFPIYLVVYHPGRDVAYWLDIKRLCNDKRFADMLAGISLRKLVFQKAHTFAENCRNVLSASCRVDVVRHRRKLGARERARDDGSHAVSGGHAVTLAAPPTQSPVTVTLGGTSVPVLGAVLSSYAAVYQIAIQIPALTPDVDYPIVATVNGVQSPSSSLLTVQHAQ